jgi:hypothetical protein
MAVKRPEKGVLEKEVARQNPDAMESTLQELYLEDPSQGRGRSG